MPLAVRKPKETGSTRLTVFWLVFAARHLQEILNLQREDSVSPLEYKENCVFALFCRSQFRPDYKYVYFDKLRVCENQTQLSGVSDEKSLEGAQNAILSGGEFAHTLFGTSV